MVQAKTAEELIEFGNKLGQEEVESAETLEAVTEPLVEEVVNPFEKADEPIEEVEQVVAAVEETPVEAPYEANYSFKVGDKEYEFDDDLKVLAVNKEKEDYVRDLMQRSKGLEMVKEHREVLISENKGFRAAEKEYKSKLGTYENHWAKAEKLINDGDELAAMRHLGLTDAEIKKAAMRLVDDNPESRAAYEAQSKARLDNIAAQETQTTSQAQLKAAQLEAVKATLTVETYRPEVKQVLDAVDEKAGKQGAFMDEVINQGIIYERAGQKLGVDFTAKQIVDQVVAKFTPFLTPNIATPVETQVTQQTVNKIVAPSTNKKIPGARSVGSPAQKKPASLADLNKIAEKLAQQT